MKNAKLGSISHSTMRTEDLLPCFASELEGLIFINGDYFAKPENFKTRDRLNNLIGEAQDAWNEGDDELENPENASELLSEFFDALNEFAPPYCYFGSNEGDGSDYGFWPDIDSAKENVGFVSSKKQEEPDLEFRGEWLHVTDHGNVTLYCRFDAKSADTVARFMRVSEIAVPEYFDKEIWSVV